MPLAKEKPLIRGDFKMSNFEIATLKSAVLPDFSPQALPEKLQEPFSKPTGV
jgi:hypothetical protein